MGLFKRKTIISVASVIYPLGEEPDKVPDVVKAAAITAMLQHTPVNHGIKASIMDGIGVKLAQGYAYASSKYYAGMPNGLPQTLLTKNDPTLELLCEEHLRRIYPSSIVDVTNTSVNYDNDYETVVSGLITTEYHYDFYEDEVFTASGSIAVGASLILTGPIEDPTHPDEVGYHLVFTNPDISTVTIDKWYDADLFEAAKSIEQRIFIVYTLDAGPHLATSYRFGGSDARLNIFLRALQETVSGTFPAMVLKRNNVYLDDNAFSGGDWKTSEEYVSTKTYGRRMSINIDDILARVKDNPDDDDIDYVFIQPGTLINGTNKEIVKYHFNYFNRLRLNLPNSKVPFDAWVASNAYPAHAITKRNQAENMPVQSIRLADPDNPTGSVDMEIAWRYISYEEKSGVIDKYEVECGAQEITVAKWANKGTATEEYDTTKVFFRKALTSTTYAEICVCGLWHENYVYKGHSVQSAVWDAFNDPEGDYGTGFLIPLDYTIFLTLTPRERLQLGQEAFHIVFNCYVAKKQKWYQTGIFKVVLAIVSIVVVYFSMGSLTEWVAALNASIAAALPVALGVTLIAAIAAIITAAIVVTVYVGVSFVAKEAGQWAAEHWGAMWGAVVQIAATIALSYGVAQLPNMPALPPATLTQQVLNSASFILMGMSAYTQYQYVELAEQQQEFLDYVNKPNDALETVNDALEEMFPDLNIAQKAILPHPESLDEFLGRTLVTTEGLTGRLLLPITNLSELTLTPRLL